MKKKLKKERVVDVPLVLLRGLTFFPALGRLCGVVGFPVMRDGFVSLTAHYEGEKGLTLTVPLKFSPRVAKALGEHLVASAKEAGLK